MLPLLDEKYYSRGWYLAGYWALWVVGSVFVPATLASIPGMARREIGLGATVFSLAFLATHLFFLFLISRRWLASYYPWAPLFIFLADLVFGVFGTLLRLP